SMDPEGRSRTGISAVDSCVLYLVSYLGVVSEMLRMANDLRKMAEDGVAASVKSDRRSVRGFRNAPGCPDAICPVTSLSCYPHWQHACGRRGRRGLVTRRDVETRAVPRNRGGVSRPDVRGQGARSECPALCPMPARPPACLSTGDEDVLTTVVVERFP